MSKKIYMTNLHSSGIVSGGLAMQARKTFDVCRRIGLPVEIYNPWKMLDTKDVAAFHLFSANQEIHNLSTTLYQRKIPQLVSSVFYTRHPKWKIDAVRTMTKFISHFDKGTKSVFDYTDEIMRNAEIVLPNTSDESALIKNLFKIPEKNICVVPNGVDARFLAATPDLFKKEYGDENIILSVTMLGKERKNGLNMLKALGKINHPSYIIGSFHTESEYGTLCQYELNKHPQIKYIGMFSHESEMLASAYAAAKVFVLPSWFETPGLSSMEAALTGAEVVTTPVGGTKEYFKDLAIYIDPYNVESIVAGIETALNRDGTEQKDLKNFIRRNFLWKEVAKKYSDIYARYL